MSDGNGNLLLGDNAFLPDVTDGQKEQLLHANVDFVDLGKVGILLKDQTSLLIMSMRREGNLRPSRRWRCS